MKNWIINKIGCLIARWIIHNCEDGLVIKRQSGSRQIIKVFSEPAYRNFIKPAICKETRRNHGNDLISRKEAKFVLEKIFDEYRMSYGERYGGFAEAVPRAIDSIPTAYDVDKVVEHLEEERDYCYKEMEKEKENTNYFSGHIFEEYHNQGMAYNKAIEIVKSGINGKE